MSTFLFGRWMILLKVETKLLVLPKTMHQCKIQYGDTTGVKSAVLTTPKHHQLLEQSCDKSGEEVAYAPDATEILASKSSLPWRIFTFAFFLHTTHTMAKPNQFFPQALLFFKSV